MSNATENFDILVIRLSVGTYNYLDDPIKSFSDLYLPKILDTSRIILSTCFTHKVPNMWLQIFLEIITESGIKQFFQNPIREKGLYIFFL